MKEEMLVLRKWAAALLLADLVWVLIWIVVAVSMGVTAVKSGPEGERAFWDGVGILAWLACSATALWQMAKKADPWWPQSLLALFLWAIIFTPDVGSWGQMVNSSSGLSLYVNFLRFGMPALIALDLFLRFLARLVSVWRLPANARRAEPRSHLLGRMNR